MVTLREWVSRLWGTLRGHRIDRDLEDELRAHLELAADESQGRGDSPEGAGRAVRLQAGGLSQALEALRDQRGLPWLENLTRDVRYGLRLLRRSPVFTAAAVLSLGLGIGANTAIFTMINALSLKTLPVRAPEELVLFSVIRGDESFSYPLYQQFGTHRDAFSGIAATGGAPPMRMVVPGPAGSGLAELVQTQPVSGNLFTILGVNAVAGRTLAEDDDRPADPQAVVVISDGLWNQRFGRDPAVVGQKILLNEAPVTIVGVAPPGFHGVQVGSIPDIWWPLQMSSRLAPGGPRLNSGAEWLRLIGRLQPGVTATRAQAEMEAVYRNEIADIVQRRTATQGAAFTQAERDRLFAYSLRLMPGNTGWSPLRSQLEQPLVVLMTLVGLVLLIACANVANLLLARATARRKEITMRLALGASRGRLIRQLLTEGLLLAIAGGALGLVLSRWSVRLLLLYVPYPSIVLDVTPDVRILGFTLAVAAATGLLCSLAPALKATRSDLVSGLKEPGSVGSGDGRRWTLNNALVVSQVALSMLLVFGAGLFVRTLQNLQGLEMGFSRENVAVFSLNVPTSRDVATRTNLYQRLLTRLEALPGVRSASVSTAGLLSGYNWSERVSIAGYTPQLGEDMGCRAMLIGPRFFETLGTPAVLGRAFGVQDAPSTSRVAIINQTMARRFFGDGDPIGRHFTFGGWQKESFEIVGVVADVRYRTLREPMMPTFYLPLLQTPTWSASGQFDVSDDLFEIRTSGALANLATTIGRAVQEVESQASVLDVHTMDDVIDQSLVQERLVAQLTGLFGALALVLAAIGLYGVRSYAVARRTNEIGIRVALGASPGEVGRMVLRGSLALVATGMAIGLPLALVASRAVRGFLFGLGPSNPMTILMAVGVMTSVGALASYLPARRAASVNPMVALRHE